MKESLNDEKYRVKIDTIFEDDTLKVGEVFAQGKNKLDIILCAHLCHPAMVNDDLTGVVVGIEIMRPLLARKNLRYNYCFLIFPEPIGSIAYLSHNEENIKKMYGGLFLEMLGLENPHALQLSFEGTTVLDQCFKFALKKNDPFGWTDKFLSVIQNDERHFNAPGGRFPMLSLSRVLPRPSKFNNFLNNANGIYECFQKKQGIISALLY